MKKGIVIGATSGIGKQLAIIMSKDEYEIGVTGRRIELLESLKEELPNKSYIRQMDIVDTKKTIDDLNSLISEMGNVDLIIVSAGIGYENEDLKWDLEKKTIDTNVSGVTAVVNCAMQYFMNRKSGHLVVISSLAGIRGSAICPAYNASKAYISNYLEGLRGKIKRAHLSITITDIKPGLVDTAMAKGEGVFWVMPVEKVSKQIYKAIKKKKIEAVVTKRWRIIGFILKIIPKSFYKG